MTVIRPNSLSGISSITCQGNTLAIHDSDHNLIRELASGSGISTFSKVSITGVTTQFGQINFGTAGTASTIFANGNAAFSGIVTATTFVGSGSGLTGVASTDNISTGTVANMFGGLTVGTAATIKSNGNATFAGIVTASSFVGDGSGLSGISGVTINGNAANRIIAGSDSSGTLSGQANLTFSSDVLQVSSSTQGLGAKFINTGNEYTNLQFSANRSSARNALGIINAKWNNNDEVAAIYLQAGDDTTNKDDGIITFFTKPSGGSIAQRLIIQDDGDVTPGADNSTDLGRSDLRWANVYTADLKLSNEGSQNDVDGTWGSYTIQEGENDLFLINKRNGKKYKFNLTEVS